MHRLADLAPGRYRLRLTALQPDGSPRLLLPATHTLRFDGHRAVEEPFHLEPAGSIRVVVHGTSDPTLVLRREHGGTPLRARWHRAASRAHELDEPLPAGRYALDIRAPGVAERRRVRVVAGRTTDVEVTGE